MAQLEVKHLSVDFHTHTTPVRAVQDVSFSLRKGETLAIVGESGSGKSTVALSVLQLLPYPTARHSESSSIRYNEQELVHAPEAILRTLRGNRISMVFQEPMTALNPLHSIFKQISEPLFVHRQFSRAEAMEKVKALLDDVGLSHLHDRLDALPHQLSGGERQRVMIATAIANQPDILIADEPTTALDVTVQEQILTLLQELQKKMGLAILLITHDLTLVRKVADKVIVMKNGGIVESGTVKTLFSAPQHEYTKMLLASEPSGSPAPAPAQAPLIMACENLSVRYPTNKPLFPWNQHYNTALKHVSVRIPQGTTLGVVGESGSGKSTLGFALLRLLHSEGSITFDQQRIDSKNLKAMRPLRKFLQPVFQDPFGSLNPRMTIERIIGEGLHVHRIGATSAERQARIDAALEEVGIPPENKHRYPHEFSGGQRQRISIARALVLQPRLLVLDEPTSSLDFSVQKQVLALLRGLQEKHGLSYLFISHDLRVIKAVSHQVIVMRRGEIIEEGDVDTVFNAPRQEYTRTLLRAALSHQS